MYVCVAVLDYRGGARLSSGAIDLQRAGHEDVVLFAEPDVERVLDAESCRVDEVGVLVAARDENERRFSRPTRLGSPGRGRVGAVGVAPQAGGLHRLGHRLEQSIVAAPARPLSPASFKVELFLDLVSAGVGDLVPEISEL